MAETSSGRPGFELRWSTATKGFASEKERAREPVELGGGCGGGGGGVGGVRERRQEDGGGWRWR